MPRWMRALAMIALAALAATAAALVLTLVSGRERISRHADHSSARPHTHEDVIDALSDEEKRRMLRELGHHG